MSALFHVMRPPSTPRAKAPLLVLLHGYGSNESDLIGLSPYLDERLMMVSARAPIPMGNGGNDWFPGLSLVVDPNGRLIDEHLPTEGMTVTEITKMSIASSSKKRAAVTAKQCLNSSGRSVRVHVISK